MPRVLERMKIVCKSLGKSLYLLHGHMPKYRWLKCWLVEWRKVTRIVINPIDPPRTSLALVFCCLFSIPAFLWRYESGKKDKASRHVSKIAAKFVTAVEGGSEFESRGNRTREYQKLTWGKRGRDKSGKRKVLSQSLFRNSYSLLPLCALVLGEKRERKRRMRAGPCSVLSVYKPFFPADVLSYEFSSFRAPTVPLDPRARQ